MHRPPADSALSTRTSRSAPLRPAPPTASARAATASSLPTRIVSSCGSTTPTPATARMSKRNLLLLLAAKKRRLLNASTKDVDDCGRPEKRLCIHSSSETDDKDLISNLPLEVRCHILCFLPTIDAVRSSVLSSKWRYAWQSVPTLYMDYSLLPNMERSKKAFANFIDQWLLLHNESEIQIFNVSIKNYGGPETCLNEWIETALSHKVRVLTIRTPEITIDELPSSIFTSQSLVSLTLDLNKYSFCTYPPSIGFKRLKKLQLHSAVFYGNAFFGALFSTCLLLEKLYLIECKMIDVREINMDASKLKRLKIFYCRGVRHLKISAPSLRYISYKGFLARNHHIETLPSLVIATLDPYSSQIVADVNYQHYRLELLKILSRIKNVEALTLSTRCIELISAGPTLKDCLPLIFHAMKKLVVRMQIEEDHISSIIPLLMSCPNLESITVEFSSGNRIVPQNLTYKREELVDVLVSGVWCCKLKTVELYYVCEIKYNVALAKFFLRNAMALEKITIKPKTKEGNFFEKLMAIRFRQELEKFPKASTSIMLDF